MRDEGVCQGRIMVRDDEGGRERGGIMVMSVSGEDVRDFSSPGKVCA